MTDYSPGQAQRDIAALRGQLAHLAAYSELLQVVIDTQLTTPDGSTWTTSGLSMASGKYITGDSWHSVTIPAGLTGTLRCKLSPVQNITILDGSLNFTYTGSSQTFTCGSMPSASYYPAASLRYPISVTGTDSGVTSSFPHLFIPTSGGVQVIVPSGSGSGVINFTQLIPTD